MDMIVDRGSSCAADDAFEHWIRVQVPEDATLEETLTVINHRGYPNFGSWLVQAGRNGRPLAAIRIRYVAYIADQHARIADLTSMEANPALYFAFRNDDDPDTVRGDYLAHAHLPLSEQVLPARETHTTGPTTV